MSIEDEIAKLVSEGKLFCLETGLPGEENPRTVFVTNEMFEVFSEPWGDSYDDRAYAKARAVMDDFVAGGYVTVAQDPFDKDASSIMARVHPVESEIFDFRCLDPKPQIRILGRFAASDTFIALAWDFRDDIDWDEIVSETEATWNELFPDTNPLKRDNINGYISYNVESV